MHIPVSHPRSDRYTDLLGGANTTQCVPWIETVLDQCVTDVSSYASVILALISIGMFFIAGLPQMWKNCRGKASDSLSAYLLLAWILGDGVSLVGTILTNQLPLQKITAGYYVFADVVLCAQFLLSVIRDRINMRRGAYATLNEPSKRELCAIGLFMVFTFSALESNMPLWQQDELETHNVFPAGRSLLHYPLFQSWKTILGYVLGCTATTFYLASRIPQLYKNRRRRSVEGISLPTFALIVFGNSTYAASVLLGVHGDSEAYYINATPWLVGSFGVMFLDFILFWQFYRYHRKEGTQELDSNRVPLPGRQAIN